MKLKELIQDMAQLETELRHFEGKFGVKSHEFYQAITAGELDEFDALDEYRMEFIEWLALYKSWISLDEKYRQLTLITNTSRQISNAIVFPPPI